jgi:hypothetical protein
MNGAMNPSVLMVLILALVLLSVLSPFSALALLMLVLFVPTLLWAVWTVVQSFIQGEPERWGLDEDWARRGWGGLPRIPNLKFYDGDAWKSLNFEQSSLSWMGATQSKGKYITRD